jgi:hypothetical protein
MMAMAVAALLVMMTVVDGKTMSSELRRWMRNGYEYDGGGEGLVRRRMMMTTTMMMLMLMMMMMFPTI